MTVPVHNTAMLQRVTELICGYRAINPINLHALEVGQLYKYIVVHLYSKRKVPRPACTGLHSMNVQDKQLSGCKMLRNAV